MGPMASTKLVAASLASCNGLPAMLRLISITRVTANDSSVATNGDRVGLLIGNPSSVTLRAEGFRFSTGIPFPSFRSKRAVTAGKLDLGPWEQVFYGEFDGRRPKKVLVKIIGD